MNIIKNKNRFFIFSAVMIIISIASVALFGLNFAIDFTGGSRIGLDIENANKEKIKEIIEKEEIEVNNIIISDNDVLIRTAPITQENKNNIVEKLTENYEDLIEKNFETVGPTIGSETQVNAVKAVVAASIAITLYVAFAFRRVSKPVSSWKYGVTAIITLIHDVVIVVGMFSILGFLFKVELDALFITAMLTVMGFSVHDTIVVFDRIRENLKKNLDLRFEEVINNALMQTLNRSINTSITVAIVLVALILFGGESIRWFIVALTAGVIIGTYSSIFVASPLLVDWNEWSKKKNKNKD